MTTETTIPADILAMMEAKKIEVRKQIAEREEAKARELEEQKAKGLTLFNEWIEKSLVNVPEWLRGYFDQTFYKLDDDDFCRLGRGNNNYPERLFFSIPGLVTIEQDTNNKKYKSAYAWWNESMKDDPEIQFRRDCMEWREDLAYVLCEAEKQFKEHEKHLRDYATQKEESARRFQEEQAREEAREIKTWNESREEIAREKTEAQVLFDVLQGDPIALHLLKAFVLLREERSQFESRLYEADEALYSVENRWSRRAEELRRQADEAERRAADEKSRLQDELDDAEKKLKRAERGW